MPDDSGVQRALGEVCAEIRALRLDHKRHAETTDAISSRVLAIELRLAADDGAAHVRSAYRTVAISVAGLFGGAGGAVASWLLHR